MSQAKPGSPPVVLTILDGWGCSDENTFNAVANAKTPVMERLWREAPHTTINASGASVGLPGEQMGNSEVGHLNLGAGRVVYQEFTRISRSIKTGSFYTNATLTDAVDQAIGNRSAIHILGLLSPGGVHSHEQHLHAMIRLAVERGAKRVYLHAFLDGRDTPPSSAEASIIAVESLFKELGCGELASIVGRYYAMDRDHRWPRVQAAYDLITGHRAALIAPDALTALHQAYARDESDEFVQPTAISATEPVTMADGDVIIFMNFRSDRARQITRPFIEPEFNCFERAIWPQLSSFVSLTEYSADYHIPTAYPPERLGNVFGDYISRMGLHQLRIAETEKYAHVTFFFNGGREEPFEWEERILVPSPDVGTYDEQPQMSAAEVTDRLLEAIESGRYDAIICNFANPDMVGHTGNYEATVSALEYIDECVGRVEQAIRNCGGQMLITADHGNAEKMVDETSGQAHTAHTSNPVPLIYIGDSPLQLSDGGSLSDIAPTLLELMGLKQPVEMTGHSLVKSGSRQG
ncbi:2,3-bisphosphoglycerate-independent phosphoglycerate mutase [Ectothiorhodospiraceae bacterium BW-2]|nr:2,3-bisphosphoglycerate-independent phosphoglycerate mutase [Ectothiorhodospiraceae bacterium BW-2]